MTNIRRSLGYETRSQEIHEYRPQCVRLAPIVSLLMGALGTLASLSPMPLQAQTFVANPDVVLVTRGQSVSGNLGTNDTFNTGAPAVFTFTNSSGPGPSQYGGYEGPGPTSGPGTPGSISPDPGFVISNSGTGAFTYQSRPIASGVSFTPAWDPNADPNVVPNDTTDANGNFLITTDANGNVVLNDNDKPYVQTATANYELTQNGNASSVVTVFINPANPRVLVTSDAYNVQEATPIVIQPYLNDNPLNGNPAEQNNVISNIVFGPSHGTLQMNGAANPGQTNSQHTNLSQQFLYTPNAGFSGTDTVYYMLGVANPDPNRSVFEGRIQK